jgi:hypothetical protein
MSFDSSKDVGESDIWDTNVSSQLDVCGSVELQPIRPNRLTLLGRAAQTVGRTGNRLIRGANPCSHSWRVIAAQRVALVATPNYVAPTHPGQLSQLSWDTAAHTGETALGIGHPQGEDWVIHAGM